jgi:hypothetical protein
MKKGKNLCNAELGAGYTGGSVCTVGADEDMKANNRHTHPSGRLCMAPKSSCKFRISFSFLLSLSDQLQKMVNLRWRPR